MWARSILTSAVGSCYWDEKTKGILVENFQRDRLASDEPADLDSDLLQVEDTLHGMYFQNRFQERKGGVVAIF
jgi:hypothetical protein